MRFSAQTRRLCSFNYPSVRQTFHQTMLQYTGYWDFFMTWWWAHFHRIVSIFQGNQQKRTNWDDGLTTEGINKVRIPRGGRDSLNVMSSTTISIWLIGHLGFSLWQKHDSRCYTLVHVVAATVHPYTGFRVIATDRSLWISSAFGTLEISFRNILIFNEPKSDFHIPKSHPILGLRTREILTAPEFVSNQR